MKVRLDFVTNSSSSSYIVAFKNDDSDSSKIIKTILDSIGVDREYKELKDYISYKFDSECYEPGEEEEFNEAYGDEINNVKNSFDKGYKVYDLRVDYNEETLVDVLKNISNMSDLLKILEEIC